MKSTARAILFTSLTLTAAVWPPDAVAQRRPARQAPPRVAGLIAIADATELTNGWARLTEGAPAEALALAERVLTRNPRSIAALALAVEAEISQGGSARALGTYEKWLGQRPLEETGIVRRIARALLAEEAAQRSDVVARAEALRALADDGDADAARQLATATSGRGVPATARASLGDPEAVKTLLTELEAGGPGQVRTIESLGQSGSSQAVPALVERLKDPRQEVRAAAVEALGKIGDRDAAPRLASLLSDSNARVRIVAAGALLQLGDPAGVPMLQAMLTDPSPDARLIAARALSSQPDSSWISVVRELTAAEEPEIRAEAARLLGPHDPEIARAVLNGLAADDNPAVRELATINMGEVVTSDLPTLRSLLKSAAPLARTRAAARVLTITR